MSDIVQVTVVNDEGSTTYDIRDPEAREAATEALEAAESATEAAEAANEAADTANAAAENVGDAISSAAAADAAATTATAAAKTAYAAATAALEAAESATECDCSDSIAILASKVADLLDEYFYLDEAIHCPASKASYSSSTLTFSDDSYYSSSAIVLA